VQYDLLAPLSLKMRKGLMQVIEDNLAAPQGFEPRYADPESAVLPLNEGAASGLDGKRSAVLILWTRQLAVNRITSSSVRMLQLRFSSSASPLFFTNLPV
jgi:hypothetical protein